ncbi:MAG: DUF2484 family protein [Boseongicola sp.]
MTTSLFLACLWGVLANIIGMLPSKHHHWPSAYALIAIGIPLLAFVVLQNGVIIGIVVFAAAASILRWPVRYLLRWCRRFIGAPVGD